MSVYAYLSAASSVAGGTTIQVTTTATSPAGSLIVVRVTGPWAVGNSPTVTDDAGHTYTKDLELIHASASVAVAIFSCVVPTQLASGAKITATWGTTIAKRAIDALTCRNPISSTPFDSAPSATAQSASSGTAISTGSAISPSTSDWVGVVGIMSDSAGSVTPQGGWTEDVDASGRLESQTIIGTSTTAIAGSGTLSSGGNWVIALATYELGSSWAAVV